MTEVSLKKARVAVNVAGVWTGPGYARELDAPALASPADVRGWLGSMPYEQRLDLSEGNRLQTQLLLREQVLVAAEQDGWAQIYAPSQRTRKEPLGYRGWMPLAQLVFEPAAASLADFVSAEDLYAGPGKVEEVQVGSSAAEALLAGSGTGEPLHASIGIGIGTVEELLSDSGAAEPLQVESDTADALLAVVTAESAWLHRGAMEDDCEPQPWLELSYLTALPVLTGLGEWVQVQLPQGGSGLLRSSEVSQRRQVLGAAVSSANGRHSGRIIVEEAKRYLGLPYLWGGVSSFGYDCSGLVYSMHLAAGFLIPRDAADQALEGISVEREDLTPGDLLFFAYEEGKGRIHHVGICAGGGRMVHSPRTGRCVELVKFDESYELYREHCATRRYWR
ncbi:Cell wall-associated hydrolase, NlpC family [Paenibacillaceae bacterium GAS479]|nr:Cell wall-associated hydrolase, NlpC family [Paenibacillaceae bacterium GAS479]